MAAATTTTTTTATTATPAQYRRARLEKQLLAYSFPEGRVAEVAVQGDGRFSALIMLADTNAWARVSVLLPDGFPLAPPVVQVLSASSSDARSEVERIAELLGSDTTWTPGLHVPGILIQLMHSG